MSIGARKDSRTRETLSRLFAGGLIHLGIEMEFRPGQPESVSHICSPGQLKHAKAVGFFDVLDLDLAPFDRIFAQAVRCLKKLVKQIGSSGSGVLHANHASLVLEPFVQFKARETRYKIVIYEIHGVWIGP